MAKFLVPHQRLGWVPVEEVAQDSNVSPTCGEHEFSISKSKRAGKEEYKNETVVKFFLNFEPEDNLLFDSLQLSKIIIATDEDQYRNLDNGLNQLFIDILRRSADPTVYKIPRDICRPLVESHLKGHSNLMHLNDLSMEGLLLTIRMRYLAGEIYSSIGPRILAAVNPYRLIPEFSHPKIFDFYKFPRSVDIENLPPHPFMLARHAYLQLVKSSTSQSIIITGESGAGKTETTKLLLRFLAETSSERKKVGPSIENALLNSNPVLESLGNAQTSRNDNSSRFGKYIRILYDTKATTGVQIKATSISTYLLEKCRLTSASEDEANYHIFYQFIRGIGLLPAELVLSLHLNAYFSPNLKEWKVKNGCLVVPEGAKFHSRLLGDVALKAPKGCPKMQTVAESKSFLDAVKALNFCWSDNLFRILSVCIHLSEVNVAGTSAAVVKEDSLEVFDVCGDLLQYQGNIRDALDDLLCKKALFDPISKCDIYLEKSQSEAVNIRDSLIRTIFDKLFNHTVRSIDVALRGDVCGHKEAIGLLDIYGFEVFGEQNSFEQLCINYANERLQGHFNRQVFEQEQYLYQKDGIGWSPLTFNDNKNVVAALDHKTYGVWGLLDQECQRPKGDERNFCLMMHRHKQQNIVTSTRNRLLTETHFVIKHYAGDVEYDTTGFIFKNKDNLGAEAEMFLRGSDIEFLHLTSDHQDTRRPTPCATPNKRQKRLNQDSISKVFRGQLDFLIAELEKTDPAYIRCIKPNSLKKPGHFDANEVVNQLKSGGMLESIRIRKLGYLIRIYHGTFVSLVKPLCIRLNESCNERSLCQKLLEALDRQLESTGSSIERWQVGDSKVFLKEDFYTTIYNMVDASRKKNATVIQAAYRRYKAMKRYQKIRFSVIKLQSLGRGFLGRTHAYNVRARRNASICLQSVYRGVLCRREYKKRYQEVQIACTVIHKAWMKRSIKKRNAAMCIQKQARQYLEMRKLTRCLGEHVPYAETLDPIPESMTESNMESYSSANSPDHRTPTNYRNLKYKLFTTNAYLYSGIFSSLASSDRSVEIKRVTGGSRGAKYSDRVSLSRSPDRAGRKGYSTDNCASSPVNEKPSSLWEKSERRKHTSKSRRLVEGSSHKEQAVHHYHHGTPSYNAGPAKSTCDECHVILQHMQQEMAYMRVCLETLVKMHQSGLAGTAIMKEQGSTAGGSTTVGTEDLLETSNEMQNYYYLCPREVPIQTKLYMTPDEIQEGESLKEDFKNKAGASKKGLFGLNLPMPNIPLYRGKR